VLHWLKTEREPASETSCFLKKFDNGQVPEKKILSVNFSHVTFSLLDFLTLEHGTNRLSQKFSKALPLNAAIYLRKAEIAHDDLAMKALISLHSQVQRFIYEFQNPHILKHQTHVLYSNKYGTR